MDFKKSVWACSLKGQELNFANVQIYSFTKKTKEQKKIGWFYYIQNIDNAKTISKRITDYMQFE